jgi:cytochrome b6-f complex iron-sulfur subunit
MRTLSRRALLVVGAGAAASQAIGCGGPLSESLPAEIAAGAESSVTAGTLRPLEGQGVALGRDANGIYALSLLCTHEGCDISSGGSVSASGIQCGCHGARFDAQGNVVQGPARSSLVHFLVTRDAAGQLTIHTTESVDPSTRLS